MHFFREMDYCDKGKTDYMEHGSRPTNELSPDSGIFIDEPIYSMQACGKHLDPIEHIPKLGIFASELRLQLESDPSHVPTSTIREEVARSFTETAHTGAVKVTNEIPSIPRRAVKRKAFTSKGKRSAMQVAQQLTTSKNKVPEIAIKAPEPKKRKEATIRTAIVATNYPATLLTPNNLTLLSEAIIDEILLGCKTSISFGGIHFKRGYLLLECMDEDTVEWLRLVIAKLKTWRGPKLCMKRDIPKSCIISMNLPRSSGQASQKTLALLAHQNHGLDTNDWKILSCKDKGVAQILTAEISIKCRDKLERWNYLINYRFNRLSVSCKMLSEEHDLL